LKFCLILNSNLLMSMMISKLTQISCWVTYDDLELVLYRLYASDGCHETMRDVHAQATTWFGWASLMVPWLS
jgi:hypothetical protein